MPNNPQRSVLGNPEIEVRKKGEATQLVGYAAKFDSLSEDLGGYREIIRRGAFDDSLAENPDVSARVREHDGGLTTIGRTTNGTLKLNTDDKGLHYEVTPPNTQAGRDILELVSNGYIDKSSFAFSLRDNGQVWHLEDEPAIRELLNVNLHDIAPVDGPAYQATTVEARSAALASLADARAGAPPEPEPAPVLSDEEAFTKMRLEIHDEQKRCRPEYK